MGLNERIQELNEIIKGINHPDLKDAWYALRDDLSTLRDENHVLKERVKTLEELTAEKQKYRFERGVYWDATGEDKVPFCKRCMEAHKKPFHLSPYHGGLLCDSCGWYCDKDGVGHSSKPVSVSRPIWRS